MTKAGTPAPPAPTTRARPLPLTTPEVRAFLAAQEGEVVEIRRTVKAPKLAASGGGRMLVDLSRAWADRGFPSDDAGQLLPMDRWQGGPDPAPESCYRNWYLHVPVAHPADGWAADPRDDGRMRLYCPWGEVGDTFWARETWRLEFDRGSGRLQPDGRYRNRSEYRVAYRAGGDGKPIEWVGYDFVPDPYIKYLVDNERWLPATRMPFAASRLTITLRSVRVEREPGGEWVWVGGFTREEQGA